ncbi:amino acid-binding ACT domain-containing protein [Rhodanobacter sp. Root480]|jgi:hypothetical protein|uniref:hypothetical protein n=1 Tax=Rhodanobacter sp. Root480 TaxID=1736542 RepID=UPI0006F42D54|nr:hypothetical protein [Rhodanobacter sp. Root480]KQX99607.1 amino acid-binding ACT domain-containing protein [Rhodanobacter sp. Root480]
MKDLSIVLDHQPGSLARLGQTLGRAGVSVEGGGAWVGGGLGLAHFLVHDAAASKAEAALADAGIRVMAVSDVLVQRLRQDVPGQLGALCGRMAEAGVNIEVLYSDHDNQLILVVDNLARGREVTATWMCENRDGES